MPPEQRGGPLMKIDATPGYPAHRQLYPVYRRRRLVSSTTSPWLVLSDPLVVGVLSAIAGAVGGCFLGDAGLLKKRATSARRQHKQRIVEALGHSLPSDHLANYDGNGLQVPPLEWGRWDRTSMRILAHLKDPNYGALTSALEGAKQAYGRHLDVMNAAIATYEARANSALGEPHGLTKWTGLPLGTQAWYNPADIRKILFEDYRSRIGGGSFDPLVLRYERNPVIRPDMPGFQLVLGNVQVATGTENQMRSLRESVRPLTDDDALRKSVRTLDSADRARVADPTKSEFEQERGDVLNRLGTKAEAVRGKCELCPSFWGIEPLDSSGG